MLIRKASSLKDLKAVWKLTHDMYVAEGYAQPQPDGMLCHYPHLDGIPETAVFVAEDERGRIVGTNSLTLDGPAGLHVDDDFKDLADAVRAECRREAKTLGASWRIVTEPGYRQSLDVVMRLITATIEEGRRWGGLHVWLFTFNPKHQKFYNRMLDFRTISDVRDGHSVGKAPAILMRGEMENMVRRWEQVKARHTSARLPHVNVSEQAEAVLSV